MDKTEIDNVITNILSLIKQTRTEKGLSQQDVANYLSTSQNVYSKLERGLIILDVGRFLILLEVLDIPMFDLISIAKLKSKSGFYTEKINLNPNR